MTLTPLIGHPAIGAEVCTGMTIIYLLIIVSLIVAICFLGAFLWAVRDGQYEDAVSPAIRVLFEEEIATDPSPPTPTQTETEP